VTWRNKGGVTLEVPRAEGCCFKKEGEGDECEVYFSQEKGNLKRRGKYGRGQEARALEKKKKKKKLLFWENIAMSSDEA